MSAHAAAARRARWAPAGGGMSVWEHCADGSWIVIGYRDGRIVAVETDAGSGAERCFVDRGP